MDGKGRGRSVFRYIVLIIVFLAVMVALYAFFSSRKAVVYTSPPSPVHVVYPQVRTIEQGVHLTGYVMSGTMVPVVPFVGGTIEEYSIKAGDEVSKGDVIAVIDKRPYELMKAQAEAQVKGLEAAYSRVEALFGTGGASAQERDTLSAQLEAARAQLGSAALQLSYTDVGAPVSGTVVQVMAGVGTPASDETPLAMIADLDDLTVDLAIGERYYGTIASGIDGLSVSVESSDGSASSSCSVVSIAPFVDPESKTFTLRVRLDDPSSFVPGMFVRASVVWDSGEYLSLPLSVRKLDGSAYAVSEDGSTAEYMALPRIAEDGSCFAVDPSLDGRAFIIRGQERLLPGEPVAVIEGSI